MLALPPPTMAVMRVQHQVVPTHIARIQCKRRFTGGHAWDTIGTMAIALHDDRSMRRLNKRMDFLRYRLSGVEVDHVITNINGEPEQRKLSDLQRFKRKMGMVLRAYEEEKQAIKNLERGLFVDTELARLERDLAEAWAKAEEIYGCTREQFHQP